MGNRASRVPLRVALRYALFAGLWILVSDTVLLALVKDPLAIDLWQTAKGWGFAAVTSLLLYLVLRREQRVRQQAEDALRESEAQYRDLYQDAPYAYFAVGTDGSIHLANRRAGELLGCSVEALVGRPVIDLYADTPAGKPRAEQMLARFVAGETIDSEELEMQHTDGRTVWVSLMVRPVRDAQGRVVQSRSIAIDITERVQAEAALRHSEQRYRSLFEAAPAMYVITHNQDGEPIIADCNALFLRTLGYAREEMVGSPMHDLYTPRSRAIAEQSGGYRRALEGRFGAEERELVTRGGKVVQTLTQAVPETDLEGVVYGTRVMFMDITERKRVEEALRESEARYRLLVDSSPYAIAIYQENRLVFVNPAALQLLGAETPEQLLGKPIAAVVHPDHVESARARLERMLAGEHGLYPIEGQYVRLDGSVVPVEVIAAPFAYRGKPAIQVLAADITERVQSEAQIRASLQEKVQLLRELYHRTKNNMQVISSMLALQAAFSDDEQVHQVFQDTRNRIQAMALVHEKLYQSQNLSTVNLDEYIGELAQLLVATYQVTRGKVAIVLDMERIVTLIDTAVPCGLILNELISNALKYAFPGEQSGEIRIALYRTGQDTITLQVADDGVGMAEVGDDWQPETFGLQTVKIIAEHQLQGTVTCLAGKDHRGVTWQVKFRDNLYQARV
jgi:PAS domain S-box-containing protein